MSKNTIKLPNDLEQMPVIFVERATPAWKALVRMC